MIVHVVEFLADEWLLLGAEIKAHSPLQAVIRVATREGLYRARAADHPVEASEYFKVPRWGPPETVGSRVVQEMRPEG